MNKVIFLGNLTRDPDMGYTQSETPIAIARFSLAVNRRYSPSGEQGTDFFNCIAFGKQAEFVEKYFRKGSRMLLCGRLQNNNYTNRNGEKVYSVQVIAEEIDFGEKKETAPVPASQSLPQQEEDDFMNIPDDINHDFPFN